MGRWSIVLSIVVLCTPVGAWEESQTEQVQTVTAQVDTVGVDLILERVNTLVSTSTPAATEKLSDVMTGIKLKYAGFKEAFDAVVFDLSATQDTASQSAEWAALTGSAVTGLSMLALSHFDADTVEAEILLAYGLDTYTFGKLVNKVDSAAGAPDHLCAVDWQTIGKDPFTGMPILSNIQAVGWIAESSSSEDLTVEIPAALAAKLSGPMSVSSFSTGVCFNGTVGSPTAECGEDVLCAMAKDAIGDTGLSMNGCLAPQATSELNMLISDLKLSPAVEIEEANIKFSCNAVDTEATFGATAIVGAKLDDDWVRFHGTMALSQQGTLSLLQIKAAMSGYLSEAFGVDKLMLHDLAFETEVGVAGGLPVIDRLILGGGMCLGTTEKCKSMVTAKISTGMAEQGGESQELAETDGTLALRVYIGFDISSGEAFFYAALTETTIGDLVQAFAGQSVDMPKWLAEVTITGYDQASCDEGNAAACFAYLTMAEQKQTIDTLSPPLVIQSGLTAQGRVTVLGAEVGFGMRITSTFFKLDLDAPKLSLAGGKVSVQQSSAVATRGPAIKMKADFSAKDYALMMSGFCKVEGVGEANVIIAINNDWQIFNISEMALFGGSVKGSVILKANLENPSQMSLNASLDIGEASAELFALAAGASKPIEDLKNKVQELIDKANNGIDVAEEAVAKASKKCADATEIVEKQEKHCEFLLAQEEQMVDWAETPAAGETEDEWAETTAAGRHAPSESKLVDWGGSWFSGAVNSVGDAAKSGVDAAKELQNKAEDKAKELAGKANEAKGKAEAKANEMAEKANEAKGKATDKAKELKEKANEAKTKAAAYTKEKANKAKTKAAAYTKETAEKAKDKASTVCKDGLEGISGFMDAACDSGVDLATSGLDQAQEVVDALASKTEDILSAAEGAIEFLKDFTIESIDFSASGLESKVTIVITLLMQGVVKVYNMDFELKGSSASEMAKDLFNQIFKQVSEAITKQINDWLKIETLLLEESNTH